MKEKMPWYVSVSPFGTERQGAALQIALEMSGPQVVARTQIGGESYSGEYRSTPYDAIDSLMDCLRVYKVLWHD